MDLRCGTRMSLSTVTNPHMKKRLVTMASAPVCVVEVSLAPLELLTATFGIEKSRPFLLSPRQNCNFKPRRMMTHLARRKNYCELRECGAACYKLSPEAAFPTHRVKNEQASIPGLGFRPLLRNFSVPHSVSNARARTRSLASCCVA